MRTWIILFIGLLLGFVFGRQWIGDRSHESERASEVTVVEPAKPQADSQSMELYRGMQRPVQETNPSQSANDTDSDTGRAVANTGSYELEQNDSVPKTLNISISDELVSDMEDQWADLPNQIRLKKERRGYRVVYLRGDSIFAQTGLQTGDLITRESLERMNDSFRGNEQLTTRVARILGHVSSY